VVPAVAALAPRLEPADARALAGTIVEAMQRGWAVDELASALVALARRLPSSEERLNLFISALKYPTVYDEAQDVLIESIKGDSEAKAIKSPGDVWAVVKWLKVKPGIDLTTPPQRTAPTTRR
jgi:hypothetical protein